MQLVHLHRIAKGCTSPGKRVFIPKKWILILGGIADLATMPARSNQLIYISDVNRVNDVDKVLETNIMCMCMYTMHTYMCLLFDFHDGRPGFG